MTNNREWWSKRKPSIAPNATDSLELRIRCLSASGKVFLLRTRSLWCLQYASLIVLCPCRHLQTLRPLRAADSRQPNILWRGCQRANPSPLSSKSAYFHHDNCTRHQLSFVLTPFCVSPSFFPAGPAGAFESESLGLEVHRAGNFLWHRSVGFVDIKVGSFASLQPGTCLQLAGCKSFEGASRGWTQKDEKSNYVEKNAEQWAPRQSFKRIFCSSILNTHLEGYQKPVNFFWPQAKGQMGPINHSAFVWIWVCLKIGYIPNYSHLISFNRDNDQQNHWV